MHNLAHAHLTLVPSGTPPAATIRGATEHDIPRIVELVNGFAAERLMLTRTAEQVELEVEDYVVASDPWGRVIACAALEEYSPSLAEIASVAVHREWHGRGLGSDVVLEAERLARMRGVEELFALSLVDPFFLSLGYATVAIAGYPEKLQRYARMMDEGKEIVPKRCFAKRLLPLAP